ncbi:MAG: BPL-N domain-containing protein [Candidatus Helarchaeota archaeon]
MVDAPRVPKIALYIGPGAELANWVATVLLNYQVPFRYVKAEDIRGGILDRFKVLIMSGGYTMRYLPGLREDGCLAIQEFLQSRKGAYLGICAGAYITGTPELGISKSKMIRKSGIFQCKITLLDRTHPIFKNVLSTSLLVYYQNGPHILSHPSEKSLALYDDNTSSVIEKTHEFPVILFSWHPEKLPHTYSILLQSIDYLLTKSP